MKSNLLKFIVIFFLTSFNSCQKDIETYSDLVIGRWDWVNSVSPWTGQVSNPLTVGYSVTLEFTIDGVMREYKDGTLSNSTIYSFEINSIESNSNFLTYNSGIRSQVYIGNDSLILNAAYVDGPVSTYIRKTR
jgi:hypothetical protein